MGSCLPPSRHVLFAQMPTRKAALPPARWSPKENQPFFSFCEHTNARKWEMRSAFVLEGFPSTSFVPAESSLASLRLRGTGGRAELGEGTSGPGASNACCRWDVTLGRIKHLQRAEDGGVLPNPELPLAFCLSGASPQLPLLASGVSSIPSRAQRGFLFPSSPKKGG